MYGIKKYSLIGQIELYVLPENSLLETLYLYD